MAVIQILGANDKQQEGGSDPSQPEGRSKTQASSSKTRVLRILKHLKFDKKVDNKRSVAVDESQEQGRETTGPNNKCDEAAVEANPGGSIEVNGDEELKDGGEGGKNVSKSDGSSTEEMVAHPVDNGITAKESKEDSKYCGDSSKRHALSEENVAQSTDNGIEAYEIEEEGKDCGEPSETDASSHSGIANNSEGKGEDISNCAAADALSAKENAVADDIDEKEGDYRDFSALDTLYDKDKDNANAKGINEEATANEAERNGEDDDDCSASDGLSGKYDAVAEVIEGYAIANGNKEEGEDESYCSASDALSAKENGQDNGGNVPANDIEQKEEACSNRLPFGALPDKGTAHRADDIDAASNVNGEGDGQDRIVSSELDALSETSSDVDSDGGVALVDGAEHWEGPGNPSTSEELSKEEIDYQLGDDVVIQVREKDRKRSNGRSASEYLSTQESIQAKHPSDEVEVDAEASQTLENVLTSFPSEHDHRSDSDATISEEEGDSPSISPSSGQTGLPQVSNELEDTPDHDAEIENSHVGSDASSGSDIGPWVMGVDHCGDPQSYRVSPAPFDVRRPRVSEDTPSIKSRGSELDDTSPLFPKSFARLKRAAQPHQPSRSSSSAKAGSVQKPELSVDIWCDNSHEATSGGKPRLRRKQGMVFESVSNKRQLLRNGEETGVNQDPVKGNKIANWTRSETQRTPYLPNFVPNLQHPLPSPPIDIPQPEKSARESVSEPDLDPLRAAHDPVTLAALEGSATPKPGTPEPILRFAWPEYGPDVVLDSNPPILYQPKPIRPWLDERTVKNLEKQVASADWTSASSTADTGLQTKVGMRTAGPFHPKLMRFLNAGRVEADRKRKGASTAWTGSSTETVREPPPMRPCNPTPYAARNRYIGGC